MGGTPVALCFLWYPEGPARHLDASRQKLTPHCLAAIFDSQLPSPKLSLKMPPKLPLPHNRGHFFLFQNCPRGEGNCAAIERQKLSRGNFCLAAIFASRHQDASPGPLGIADYRCYTSTSFLQMAYHSPKTGLTKGVSQKKLASEANRGPENPYPPKFGG